MATPPLIVVSLEAIAPNALSCYGCSWNSTTSLDQLCGEGWIWDRLVAPTDDALEVLQKWVGEGSHWARLYRKVGPLSLIADQPLDRLGDHCFDEITVVAVDPVTEDQIPCQEVFETRFGQLIATAIERLNQPNSPSVIWIHSDFLRKCWDAPIPLSQLPNELSSQSSAAEIDDSNTWDDADELDDWETEPQQTVPLQVHPPNFKIKPEDDPDELPQWIDRYAVQIALVDTMMGYLIEEIKAREGRLVFTGTSGFRLGQDREFGFEPTKLRSADIHLPLLISGDGPMRMPHLTSSDQLPNLLEAIGQNDEGVCSADQWAESRSCPDSVRIRSTRCREAVMSPEWFCVVDPDSQENLFLKPDDLNDYNNVARLRPDVVDSLIEP